MKRTAAAGLAGPCAALLLCAAVAAGAFAVSPARAAANDDAKAKATSSDAKAKPASSDAKSKAASSDAKTKPASADALVKQGQKLYEEGALGEALLKFEDAVKAGAEGGDLFYEMGYCYKTVRADSQSSRTYMAKAAPLLEKTLDTAKTPAPYYYLSAIYTNDLNDTTKGSDTARRGVAAVEKGTFSKLKEGEPLFQVARLYSLAGQADKAAGWYERSFEAFSTDRTPNRQYQITICEQLSSYYLSKQDYDKAVQWLGRLVTLDPSRQREKLSAGLVLVRADRLDDAVKMLDGFTDDEMATEANYVVRAIRRYRDLGSPAPPAGTAAMTDAALQEALEKSAKTLADIRQKEDEANKPPPDSEELPFKWVTSKKGVKAKVYPPRVYPPEDWQPKDPNHPTPDEVQYMSGYPVAPHRPAPPPSPERIAAEKEFFSLLLETMKRGKQVREMAVTRGLTSLIYR